MRQNYVGGVPWTDDDTKMALIMKAQLLRPKKMAEQLNSTFGHNRSPIVHIRRYQ
jgi:hypothetical protein